MNKKNIKKITYLIIYILMQIYFVNIGISFASNQEIASQQTIANGTYVIKTIINNKYGLDVSQASKADGANIQLFEYVKEEQQQFNINYNGDGYYTITLVHSGKALDVAGAGKIDGTNVWQYELNNSDAQKWVIKDAGNGLYNIISKCNGLYLDVNAGQAKNGTNIQVYTGNGTNAQKFIFEKVSQSEDNENIENNNTIIGTKTISNGKYIIKTAINNKYGLDVSQASTADGANIQLFEYVDQSQQQFNINYNGDGYYTITVENSGKALDVAGAGKVNGTNVWQYQLNNSDAQKWVIKEAGNGFYNIISKCNGLYLDVAYGQAKNGANIQVYEGNGSNAQKFKFEEINKKTVEDGVYTIKTVINNKYGLDVSQASTANGANIQLFEYVKQSQQKFNIEYNENGYYTISALHSGKVLDVAGAGKVNGTNVWQYESNNSDAQKWVIKEAGNGVYNIISKCNGLYLDIAYGQAKNGANIQVYTGNGTNAQKFKIEEVTSDIDMDTKKYPGYKEKIEQLMEKHPNWNFELLYTGLRFDEVIKGEYAVHSRNLVPNNYGGEWICSVCGTKLYDSGWYCTSEKAIAYYMDTRNFLNESDIFQFQDLNEYINGVCTLEGIQGQVNGTFLQNYAKDIDTACKNQNVNSYYIVTRMIQEQGRKGTTIGKGMDGGDGNIYYNPFNIGATGNGDDEIYANALKTAKSYGWNSMEKAIEGGITFCKKNWLENYQNTLYQNKFDIDTRNGTALYQHQYMQNLMGAYSEATLMRQMYVDTIKLNSNFTFIIPVYEGMSTTNAQMPVNNSETSPINVQVTTDSGLILREGASTDSNKIKTIYKGEELLSVQRGINTNWQKVITTDGIIGYMSGQYLKQIDDVTNCDYTATVKTNDGSGCYVRIGPSLKLDRITALPDGTKVRVINKGTYNNIDGYDWCRIKLTDGRQAFMPIKYLI